MKNGGLTPLGVVFFKIIAGEYISKEILEVIIILIVFGILRLKLLPMLNTRA
jgi:hypothetical protein